MDKTFINETSYLAWKCFKETGLVGYYMLHSHLENPPKELMYIEEHDLGRDM